MPIQAIARRSWLIMIMLFICTITIIGTNYIFTKDIVIDINNTLLENEYKKIGGKENYMILQEIQRREIIGYIETIKKEQPELVEEILNKKDENSINYNMLNENIIKDLKNETFISGNSGALISIIEFSDLECEFCIKQHSEGIINSMLEKYPEKVNYSFKNFPLPTHKNAKIEAKAGKCVEKLSDGETYLNFIDKIFTTTKGGGEGFDTSELLPLAESLGINTEEFNNCLKNNDTGEAVDIEFNQGMMLKVKSVPSILIINNTTGKYELIGETINYKELEEKVLNIAK